MRTQGLTPEGGADTTTRVRRIVGGHLGDGLAMSLAAGGASLVGMLSWIVAARALTPTELGTATAFVSAFLLIAGCTEFNVGVGLLRWLPRAGGAAGAILLRAGGIIVMASAVVASLYLLLPEASIVVDAVVGGGDENRLLGAAVFVVTATLYAIFQQQDYVLVGLGRAWWAPSRTAVFAICRLGILLAAGAALTTQIVVASWLVPIALCVVLVGVQATVLVRRHRGEPVWLPGRKEVVGFLAGAYTGQLANSLLFNQVPLLVTFRFGPELGASFFLVWQAVTVIDVICLYFVSALATGVARDPERAAELSAATRRRLLMVMLPTLAVGVLVAEPVLALFGPMYTQEANILRVLLCGLAMRLFVVHRLGEHQALGRGSRYGRLAVTNTVLVLGVALAIPARSSDPLLVLAVGFVGVQGLLAATVCLRRRRDPRLTASATSPDPDGPEPGPAREHGDLTTPAPEDARLVSGSPRAGAAVSVVVPTYQGADTLADTLASIMAEPSEELEIVVLDNASTDGTPELLAAVDDPRVVVWRNPALVGLIENHERAVALASAPLIKIVSADDLVEPGALAAQVRILSADPSLAMVAGRCHFVDERGDLLARSRFLRRLVGTHDRDHLVRAVLRTGANPIGAEVSVLFRRSAYDAAGGYGAVGRRDAPEVVADLDLWLRLLRHGDLHGQRETVAGFRIRGDSRTAGVDREDERGHRRYLAALTAATPGLTVSERLGWRLRARAARWRRHTLFAVARRRAARGGRRGASTSAPVGLPQHLGRPVP